MSKEPEKQETQEQPEQKKQKVEVNSNDVDDLIGELIKEELQLLVTRMIKDQPGFVDELKHQIVRIIKSRAKQTPPPTLSSTQLQQLSLNTSSQQLFQATQSLGLQLGMSPQELFGGFSQNLPLMSPQRGFIQMGSSPMELDKHGVDVGSIRRRVRDAFQPATKSNKKRKGQVLDSDRESYTVTSYVIQEEIKIGKEAIMTTNQVRKGLSIFEAVTSEFVNRGAELGETNIIGYQELLDEISKDWTDIMLHKNMDEIGDERKQWVEKLFEWDTSPNEDEGTFSVARFACKLGWMDVQLQQVLKGEGIGKYKEPQPLSIARLNQLEREQRYEEAVNLAKAVDLDFYSAKFLLKLDKKDEAEKVGMSLTDPLKMFSIAQVARSSDVKIAFNLAIKSIGIALQWQQDTYDRAVWVCDLAISQHLEDLLVSKIKEVVKHKRYQFEFCKILKQKEQYKTAIEISQFTLTPHVETEEEIEEKKKKLQQVTNQQLTTQQGVKMTNILVVPEVDPGTIVPSGLCQWMWETSYEMLVLGLYSEREMGQLLKFILDTVTETKQLMDLINIMNNKNEYEWLHTVGEKIFELVKIQREKEYQEQKKLLTLIIEDPNYLVNNPLAQTVSLSHNSIWNTTVYQTAYAILQGASTSRVVSQTQIQPLPIKVGPKNTEVLPRPIKALTNDQFYDLLSLCYKNISLLDQNNNLTNLLYSAKEYQLVLKTMNYFWDACNVAARDYQLRMKEKEELNALKQEENEAISKNKSLKQSQIDRLKELSISERFSQIRGGYFTPQQIDNYILQFTNIQFNTVLSDDPSITFEQRESTILECISYIFNPNHLIQLGNTLNFRGEPRFTIKVGKRCLDIIVDLRNKFEQIQKLTVPINLLIEEQELLISQQKQITQQKQEELKDLQDKLKLIEVPYFDPKGMNQYDNILSQMSNIIVQGILDSKIVKKLVSSTIGQIQQPEPVIEKKPISDEKIRETVFDCLEYVKNPIQMQQILNICAREEYQLCVDIAKKIQERIAFIIAERPKFEIANYHLNELKQEEERQQLIKKQLSPEDQKKLKEMTIENLLSRVLTPSYFFISSNEYDKEHLNVANTLINMFLKKKQIYSNQLKDLIENELKVQDIKESQDMSKEQIQDLIDKTREEITQVTRDCLKYLDDPNNLVKIGFTLRNNGEYDLAIEVGKYLRSRIAHCIKERDERDKLIKELNEINNENETIQQQNKQFKTKKTLEQDKLNRMKELEKQNLLFGLLSSYSKFNNTRFDTGYLKAAEIILGSILDKKHAFPETTGLNDLVDYCLEFILDPNHIIQLIQMIINVREFGLVIYMAKKCFERITQCYKERFERDVAKIKYDNLVNEQNQLTLLRKTLTEQQQKELQSLEIKILPDYMNVKIENFDSLRHNLSWSILSSALTYNQEILEAPEVQGEDNEMKEKPNLVNIKEITELALSNIENPDNLEDLETKVFSKKDFDLTIEIGLKAISLIEKYRKDVKIMEVPIQRFIELQAEKDNLLKSRKELSNEKLELFRKLEFETKVYENKPHYLRYSSNEYDSIVFKSTRTMINCLLDSKANMENKMQLDSEVTEEELKDALEKQKQYMDKVLSQALEHVLLISNLINLINQLNSKLEYGLVISIGKKCQERIHILNENIKKSEGLNEEKQDLIQKNKVKPSQDKTDRIAQIDLELSTIIVETYDKKKIKNDTLKVAKMMMNAHKVEGASQQLLREQAIIIFKIDMSLESLGEVKILTPENEWDTVKKELMNYVLNFNKSLDQNAKLTAEQIELLLSEGMIQDCISNFPEPEGTDPQLLERLWVEIEKIDKKSLKKLLPLVESFVSYNYQNYELDNTSSLLDIVEGFDSKWVVDLFIRLSDTLLVSIVQKQYQDFVRFLELAKNRLTPTDNWEDFIEGLKKKHKGKKKLMQMIQMGGY